MLPRIEMLILRSTLLTWGINDPGGAKRHLRGRDSSVPSVEARPRNGCSSMSDFCDEQQLDSDSSVSSGSSSVQGRPKKLKFFIKFEKF